MSNRPATVATGQILRSKESLRLWLKLLACESIIEQQLRSRLRETFGITLPQFDVLAELEYVKKPLSMTELSTKLMVSNGNITGVVDRLVRNGYVKRQPSTDDRRVQLIKITAKGLEIFGAMAEQHEAWINDMFTVLDIKEIAQMSSLLNKINNQSKTTHREKKK